MKTLAVLEVNPDAGPFGNSSNELKTLGNRTVLEWAVRGLSTLDCISELVVVNASETNTASRKLQDICSSYSCTLDSFEGTDLEDRFQRLTARKWALENWRGGLNDTTVFCESENPYLLFQQIEKRDPDLLLSVPRCSPFVPRKQIEEILNWPENKDELNLRAIPAPPGFHYAAYHPRFVRALKKADNTLREMFRFSLDDPKRDPVHMDGFISMSNLVRSCSLRFSCDFNRSLNFVRALHEKKGNELFSSSIHEVVQVAKDRQHQWAYKFPREIHFHSGFSETDSWLDVGEQLEQSDDTVINLDLSDTTRNKQKHILQALPNDTFWGLHLRTRPAPALDQEIRTLLLNRADVVSFVLSANTPETFQRITGKTNFDEQKKGLETFMENRPEDRKFALPIVTVEFLKQNKNWEEEHPFFEKWFPVVDQVIIRPFIGETPEKPDQIETELVPSRRELCRKLRSTLYVEGEGTVKVCHPSRNNSPVLGKIPEDSIESIWKESQLKSIRRAHMNENYSEYTPCENCIYWVYP